MQNISIHKRRKTSFSQDRSLSKKNRNSKSIESDLSSYISKANVPTETRSKTITRSIAELSINHQIISNLLDQNFTHLTEIQNLSIDILSERRDLIGIAQTGTGKTAAYLVPIIDQLINTRANNQVLVLLPTRELALQVDEEFKKLSKGTRLYSQCFVGGTSVRRDINTLKRPAHVIIGTTGRLLDLYSQQALHFQAMDTLVLDEFDRLLDMGFQRDIDTIVAAMTQREHTILFSATEDPAQQKAIKALIPNAVKVKAQKHQKVNSQIHQELIEIRAGESKLDRLQTMIKQNDFTKVLIFAETKRLVAKLCKQLNGIGISAEQIHGNRTQAQRVKALRSFSGGYVNVLLATDVAARGLHISDVSHVINYQPPKNIDSYIHRIGRTGRAGKTGVAYTFIQS